ncbi:MAG: hypothetical protein LKF53_01315 [Solobacterium sp.]|jgi:hypothetical protein|nr:hypothetical protein [Solobacterium sp.]MCH4205018.1 hypothetical protein [Solobacterium sp.]MCH4281811.1 hypothetical protein [Solobacterium sp.]
MNKFDNYSMNPQNQSSDHPSKNDKDDFLKHPEDLPDKDEDQEDDLFARLDRMRGVSDEQLKEKELEKTGMIDQNQEITKAMQTLSQEDQDAFERTGMIHFDRTAPIEDQVLNAVNLQKKKETHQKHVFFIILGLMIAGIVISIIGIAANSYLSSHKDTQTANSAKTNPLAVDVSEESIKINESTFPDAVFREYIKTNADTNSDGMLDAEERNAVLMITLKGDPELTNVKGIELFPLLQAVTLSNTSLSEIDLSSNTLLTNINLSSTKISVLDLSKNLNVTNINLANTAMSSVIMPIPSSVNEAEMQSTGLTCTKDDTNHYDACSVAK